MLRRRMLQVLVRGGRGDTLTIDPKTVSDEEALTGVIRRYRSERVLLKEQLPAWSKGVDECLVSPSPVSGLSCTCPEDGLHRW